MNKLMIIAALVVMAGFVAGCNTVEGLGRDIERAGESIQNM